MKKEEKILQDSTERYWQEFVRTGKIKDYLKYATECKED